MISSREEIRKSVLDTTRQQNSQIGTIVNDFINLTISEINSPGWAFKNGYNHKWSFLRRKTTFATTSSTDEYVLPRDVDYVSILRQTTSPTRLIQITDQKFYDLIPDPDESGNPRFYRIWESEGVSTRLAADDTINVVSSSTRDSGDSNLTVTVWGYDTNGAKVSETYQLNGTSVVSGSITFDSGRPVFVTKQRQTTGDITVTEDSGGTTMLVMGREERGPRFKVITLYPNPSSAMTMYLEYFTTMRPMVNDSDAPDFDEKWHYVVRMGALAKTYQYLNKQESFQVHNMFKQAVKSMVTSDKTKPDLIRHLSPRSNVIPLIRLTSNDVVY